MRMNFSVELTDGEIRDLATDVARRLLVKGVAHLGERIGEGMSGPAGESFLRTIIPALQQLQDQMAPPPDPSPCGVSAPTTVDHGCLTVEGSQYLAPGWGCCRCRAYNGVTRYVCKACSHARCGKVVVTPAPAPTSPATPQAKPGASADDPPLQGDGHAD
jgi:hypothetical protein